MSVALSRCVVPCVPSRSHLAVRSTWCRPNWLMVSLKTSKPPPFPEPPAVRPGGPCRCTHSHLLSLLVLTLEVHSHTQAPCVLAPLIEGRFDAVTPVLRHVLQHPSQGRATLNLGTAQLPAAFCLCPHSRCLYCRPRAISWCIGDSTSCVAYTVAYYASLPCSIMQCMHHCTDSRRQGVPGPQVCVLGSLIIPFLFGACSLTRWFGRGCATCWWADDVGVGHRSQVIA